MSELPLIEYHPGKDGGVMATPALDAWRDAYRAGVVTVVGHRELYQRIAKEFPEQDYFSKTLVNDFFMWAQPTTVFEMGGWDGYLASLVLGKLVGNPIDEWVNAEIVEVPQECHDQRYRYVVPDEVAWAHPIHYEAFVASHVLEHLSDADFAALLSALESRFVYVDVPLGREGTDWQGTTTTHALTLSISEFDQAFHDAGYVIRRKARRTGAVPSFVRFYERDDTS